MADSNKIITLQNIDDEDFVFEYNSSEGNAPYLIAAGEVARYPEFLAKHALKHLVDKILNKSGERTGNQVRRLEIANQIIVDTEKIVQVAEPSKAERLQKEVSDLNKPSTLDVILNKRKEEKEHREKVVEEEVEGVEEEFEGLKDIPEKPVIKEKIVEPTLPEPEEVKALPTRAEVIEHAKTNMKMVIDEKTEKKFKAMKLSELMKEVQYE